MPDLLRRYAGPGGDPYGQAVITATMDATRLGHASPLPAALLQEAAVGYLTGPQRINDFATWRDTALAWAAAELNGAVRALQPVPPVAGTGVVGYQIADYLDQHGRRTRQDQLGPASLWDALTVHTSTAGDLTRLGQAARNRGLYRHAAALWTTAVTLGSTNAAVGQLIVHLHQVSPDDVTLAAQWTATQVGLGDPQAVAELLRALAWAGVSEAVTVLAARAAAQVGLGDLWAVAKLLRVMAGASEAVTVLAARAAAQVGLGDPGDVTRLLDALDSAEASDAICILLARDPAAQVGLGDPGDVAELLEALRRAGASNAVTTLLDRYPVAQVGLGDLWAVAKLLRALAGAGASNAVATLATRAATQVGLGNLRAVAELLRLWPRLGPVMRSPSWPTGPPARPASMTPEPSPGC